MAGVTPSFDCSDVAGATSYQFQVATSLSFGGSTVVDGTSASSAYGPTSALVGDTVYYWHVRAANAAGSGPWSSYWTFTTAVAPPALVAPSDGANVSTRRPTESWGSVPRALLYQVQIATDSAFTNVVFTSETSSLTAQPYTDLQANRQHFWRVRTRGTMGGYTNWWSTSRSFTTP